MTAATDPDCLFCRIVAGQIPSRRVYEDADAVAFLDVAPLHRGHTVIVPRRHVPDGTSDAAAWVQVAPAVVAVCGATKDKLHAPGVNILSNAGEVAGQSVFHFHLHVIPRYDANPGIPGLSRRDADPSPEELDSVAKEMTAA